MSDTMHENLWEKVETFEKGVALQAWNCCRSLWEKVETFEKGGWSLWQNALGTFGKRLKPSREGCWYLWENGVGTFWQRCRFLWANALETGMQIACFTWEVLAAPCYRDDSHNSYSHLSTTIVVCFWMGSQNPKHQQACKSAVALQLPLSDHWIRMCFSNCCWFSYWVFFCYISWLMVFIAF